MISLPWRPLAPRGYGEMIETSITEREADKLYDLAEGCNVLEVGSAYGFSAVVLALGARHVLAVDSHHAHPLSLAKMRQHMRAHGVADRVTIVVANSLVFLPALEAQFDLVFLDGDHRFSGLWADLEQARRLLAPAGRIAVHDYEERSCPDVRPAVTASGIKGAVLVDTLWVSDPE